MGTSSRPTALRFQYKYAPYNNDSFKAWIQLENRSVVGEETVTTLLGKGEVVKGDQQGSFTETTVTVNYEPYADAVQLPITHIVIVFSSSANCSEQESEETDNLKGLVQESYNKPFDGSVLTIDNIQLIYDK